MPGLQPQRTCGNHKKATSLTNLPFALHAWVPRGTLIAPLGLEFNVRSPAPQINTSTNVLLKVEMSALVAWNVFWIYSRRVANDVAVCQVWHYCSTGRQICVQCAVADENQTFETDLGHHIGYLSVLVFWFVASPCTKSQYIEWW
jgi:hypothetical protein